MKSIVCVNTQIPTVENEVSYSSHDSLRDYDIIVFDPSFPYSNRIDFTGGGSCLTIESMARLTKASSHWRLEIGGALAAGKTVFGVLSAHEEDQGAVGSSMTSRTQRNYETSKITNYSAFPATINVRNSRGRAINVKEASLKGLYEAVKDVTEYRVVFEGKNKIKATHFAKDGTVVGGVVNFDTWPGSLVLIPHFDFNVDDFTEESPEGDDEWNPAALKASHTFVSQIIAIDKLLRSSAVATPPPGWVKEAGQPIAIIEMERMVADIDERIEGLRAEKSSHEAKLSDLLQFSYLLFETGKPLEMAIERVLRLMGYSVDTLRIDDLEIDHVIVGPSGRRMIGESEGKDSSAIDISKFRQLESNIGEDFERECVDQPAKGVLFGNGFRLSSPLDRPEQFTKKSLTNAKRLGSALIKTTDLYNVAVYMLDHPEDDDFRAACRLAIEETEGGVVVFPTP